MGRVRLLMMESERKKKVEQITGQLTVHRLVEKKDDVVARDKKERMNLSR